MRGEGEVEYDTGRGILNLLQWCEGVGGKAKKEGVAVIEAGEDESMNQEFSGRERDGGAYFADVEQVESTGACSG